MQRDQEIVVKFHMECLWREEVELRIMSSKSCSCITIGEYQNKVWKSMAQMPLAPLWN